MSRHVEIAVTSTVRLTIENIAEAFALLDDDGQARFFVAVAKIAEAWREDRRSLGPSWQWSAIGSHLAKCECGTAEARDMVREIACAIDNPSGH